MRRIALLIKWGSILLAPAFLALASAQAQIYKFVDDHGVVNYTSFPPPARYAYKIIRIPCYVSDLTCRGVSWEKVQLNTEAFEPEIRTAARDNDVDESLIRAIIHAESDYQIDAVSPKGAQGLMQLMPETQQQLDISDPFDPAVNIEGGARYLSELLKEFNGNITLATAAYNAGPGAVEKYGGVPPFEETREYVRRVKILHRRYRQAGG